MLRLRRGSRPQWPVVLGEEAGINSSALWIQHCRLRRALSSQPLAPTHHGKPSSESAPTKENERQPWRTASFPQGQRTLGPGHEDQRPGPPGVLHHGSQPVRRPGRETTPDAAYPHLRLLQSLKGGVSQEALAGSTHKPASARATDPLGRHRTGGWLPQWAQDTKARR